jgi:hypothetical protein
MNNLTIDLTGENILLIVFFQILFLLALGWSIGTFIQIIHVFLGVENKIFKQKDYIPQANGYPQRYRFVFVKYNQDGDLQSETFYTLFGDWTHIKYNNGNYSSLETVFLSNLLLVIFPIIGFLLIVVLNINALTNTDQLIHNLTEIQLLREYGILLFFPSIITGIIKLLFDFTYTKL